MASEAPVLEKGPSTAPQEFKQLAIEKIVPSKTNPRKTFNQKEQQDLEASISQVGVQQPIKVRPQNGHFEIVFGERRFRAAKKAGLDKIPAVVQELTDLEVLEIQVIENQQRADVHPLEEADGYQALIETGNYDVDAIAARIGKGASYVYQRLKLAELIEPAKKAFLREEISAAHAVLIARLQPADQKEALDVCTTQEWVGDNRKQGTFTVSTRDLQDWIRSNVLLSLDGAPWRKDDADLVPAAGACDACPKRSGNQPGLFPEATRAQTCTDRTCYQTKLAAFQKLKVKELKDAGERVEMISDQWTPDEKGVLGTDAYRKVSGKKKCDDTVTGYYAEGGQRGKTIPICVDPECKEHRPKSTYGGGSSSGRTAAQEKARQAQLLKWRVGLRTRELIYRAIIEKTKKFTHADLELVARAAEGTPWSIDIDDLFPFLSSYGGFPKDASKVKEEDLIKYIVMSALRDDIGDEKGPEKATRLYATAKRLKIDVAQLEVEAEFQKTNEAEKKIQVKKWENRVASQATSYDEPTCKKCGCTEPKACPGGCSWSKLNETTNVGVCSSCETGEKKK